MAALVGGWVLAQRVGLALLTALAAGIAVLLLV
jgi:hypothetical protein